MNLPKTLTDLVAAQNNFDSKAYANCFSETAIVHDEGKTHKGKVAIEKWISVANEKFKTVMNPIKYSEKENILEAEISGTFPGSPLVLNYQFEFSGGKIQSLQIV